MLYAELGSCHVGVLRLVILYLFVVAQVLYLVEVGLQQRIACTLICDQLGLRRLLLFETLHIDVGGDSSTLWDLRALYLLHPWLDRDIVIISDQLLGSQAVCLGLEVVENL